MKNIHKEERKIQAKKLKVNKKRFQKLHQRIHLESIGFLTPFIKGLQKHALKIRQS